MMNLSSLGLRRGLLAAACALGALATASAQTAFTPGNYVVLRVGDGTAALSNASTAAFLVEYNVMTTPATVVQTIALPIADAGAGANAALTLAGSATSEGSLARSTDGRYLLLAGYNAAPGLASVGGTTAAATNRVIGRVAANGTVNTTTRLNDAFSTGSIRSVASASGATFYAVGANTGVVYAPLANAATSTTLSTGTPTNLRAISIAGNNLYVSTASAPTGILQVGSGGVPTTTGQALTQLPGFSAATGVSPYGFFFADLSATVPGVDVVYVADDRSSATDGGLQKWSLVNNSWVLNGTIAGNAAANLRSVTGTVAGTSVTLSAVGTGGLFVVADNTGYNGTPTATLPAALVTASTNTAFRGVALAPLATALATRPEASQQQLALYPNPAQDVLTVQLASGPAAGRPVEVRDLLGRVVRSGTLPASSQLSLAGLAPGTYLLTVDGSLTRRISKVE